MPCGRILFRTAHKSISRKKAVSHTSQELPSLLYRNPLPEQICRQTGYMNNHDAHAKNAASPSIFTENRL
ncbi:hypothetical protein [Ruminococcus callidus]|uniref:hypothetical protein n=1 Tax=Ruminococcus callidus TaxID=40519 RepID=UPI00059114FB|nr:hypothetical protein [Ruminococcus sp.]HCY35454.1 hypothetical protein [Ruminococcus sp.]